MWQSIDLEVLPTGVFVGLTSLTQVFFSENPGADFQLPVVLEERESPDTQGGFGVAATMEHGAPGLVVADLSVTAVAPDQDEEIRLVSGSEESSVYYFDWTGSECATVSIMDFRSPGLRQAGLAFVAGDPLEICPPPPLVTLDLDQVSQIEGKKVLIPFTLSSKAPASFTLRYTTGAGDDPDTVERPPGQTSRPPARRSSRQTVLTGTSVSRSSTIRRLTRASTRSSM